VDAPPQTHDNVRDAGIALRDEWGCAYRISKLLSGGLSAMRLNGSREPMTAWYPDDLRRQLLNDAGLAWWAAVVAEAA
jgi:hypothetical protein